MPGPVTNARKTKMPWASGAMGVVHAHSPEDVVPQNLSMHGIDCIHVSGPPSPGAAPGSDVSAEFVEERA